MTPTVPRMIKGYAIHEAVGAGATGTVYHAYQPAIRRDVALKAIGAAYANQPTFIRQFEAEAQRIVHLEHPHIVPVYDYWREPDGAYLVRRWLPGGNLRGKSYTLEILARWLIQLEGALLVAHRQHIVHGNLKPENLLLDDDGHVYLTDFAWGWDLYRQGDAEQPYCSPEQRRGEPLTAQSDIYSLGVIVYELLAGALPPISGDTPLKLPPLHKRRPDLPSTLDHVIQIATASDPAQRYSDAAAFVSAFYTSVAIPSHPMFRPLDEALNSRELEILRLLAADLSNREIAQRLAFSVDTIKWYLKQIYSKLDVHSRTEAVERAYALHMLDSVTRTKSVTPAPSPLTPERVQVAPERIEAAPPNPYKGLRAFQVSDAPDFFGREALVQHLLARLAEPAPMSRFLAVVGPSGSGKSSVVRAGLVPALRQEALPGSAQWFVADLLPGAHPLEELEIALLRIAVNPPVSLLSQLREDTRGLLRATRRILPDDQSELLLIIDQFEEVFTLLDDTAERTFLLDSLRTAIADPYSRLRVVITLRADFYDRPLHYPGFADLIEARTQVVVPLTPHELEQVITRPAQRVDVNVEPGLVAAMVADVNEQPGGLPLLQYALTELFEQRDDHTLTVNTYRAVGGVMAALAHRADTLYDRLDAPSQAMIRQLFLRLVTLGEGTEDTRRRVVQTELPFVGQDADRLEELIDLLGRYRLLTLDRDPLTGGPTVEIAHEALLHTWGRLRGWLDESREAVRIQRRLLALATEWVNAERDPSFLASGTRLTQFETLAAGSALALNREEHAFLDISIAERERQVASEQERRRREAALERRSRTVLRALVIVLFLATLGALGLTQVARNNAALAERNAAEARSFALASAAQLALNEGSIDQAIALAKAAQQVTNNPPPLAQLVLDQAAYAPGIRRIFQETAKIGGSPPAASTTPLKFVLVAHLGPGHPFAVPIIKGMQDACTRLNVVCQWLSDPVASADAIPAYWKQALVMNPDGIGTTIVDPNLIRSYAQQAAERGIPVIAFNVSDAQDSDPSLPALLYIGSDEFLSGVSNARRVFAEARADGIPIPRGVCAIQSGSHHGFAARCAGVKSVFDEAGVPLDELPITLNGPSGEIVDVAVSQMADYFKANPTTRAIFMLGPSPATALHQYMQQAGLKPRQLYATTHDTSSEIFQMIHDGYLLQTIDQQPYMQGFQTIISLFLYRQYGLRPSGFINTSSVVDRSTVDFVTRLVEAGYR